MLRLAAIASVAALAVAGCSAEPIIVGAAGTEVAPVADCEHVATVQGIGMGQSSETPSVAAAYYATALQMAAWHVATTGDDDAAKMYVQETPHDRLHVLCYIDGRWGSLASGSPIERVAVDLGRGNAVLWAGTKDQVKVTDPADYTLPDRLLQPNAFPTQQAAMGFVHS